MKKYLLILPCLLVLGATTPTYAEDKGAQYKPFYFHLSYGQYEIESGIAGLDDAEADAYGLAFGWQPSPYASLEFSYNHHNYDDLTDSSGDSIKIDGNHIELAVVATPIIYPVRPIFLAGILRTEIEVDSVTIGGRTINLNADANETEAVFGVGMDFDFTSNFGGRLIYKAAGGEIDAEGLFLGATFRF